MNQEKEITSHEVGKLEDELIKKAKNYKGEITPEFERFERGLYNSQSTGEYRYRELKELEKNFEEVQP